MWFFRNMINKKIMDSGLTVVCEYIPHVQSVGMGLWVKTGSRNETEEFAGISHFLEHMNFKGTAKRSARDLAEVLEVRGGQLNAYTAKDYTNFYTLTVKEDYDLALDVLSDLFLNSAFDETELEKEKKVVLEEINLYEDSPEDLVIDVLNEACWPGHPLGRPILGYEKQVKSFSPQMLRDYRSNRYTPGNTVLAVAGNFDYDSLMESVEKYFSCFCGETVSAEFPVPVFSCGEQVRVKKEIAQTHLCFGFPSCSFFDEEYYRTVLLNEYLGGGASSVLFQKVREEMGLCYSVFSFISPYEDTGMLTVYAATSGEFAEQVSEVCLDEIRRLAENGISAEDTQKLKSQIGGSLRISSDSMGTHLNRLGRNEMMFRRAIPVEEVVEKINAVTPSQLGETAAKLFDFNHSVSAVLEGTLR